jgi:hypothetical protein
MSVLSCTLSFCSFLANQPVIGRQTACYSAQISILSLVPSTCSSVLQIANLLSGLRLFESTQFQLNKSLKTHRIEKIRAIHSASDSDLRMKEEWTQQDAAAQNV